MSCSCQTKPAPKPSKPESAPPLAVRLALGLILWLLLYFSLPALSAIPLHLLSLPETSALRESIAFFLYEVPKVFLLLILAVFIMGIVRSYFTVERTRQALQKHSKGLGYILAASLGIVTPFCSCSAVPLFVGFVSAGIPLGMTFTFLIASPMVNEIALGLLLGLVGWKVASLYLIFGFTLAVLSGFLMERLPLESWVEDWVREARQETDEANTEPFTPETRLEQGRAAVKDILGKIWLWVLCGIGLGALVHGYVPPEALSAVSASGSIWSVPLSVLAGIPLYSNAAGIIPIVEALLEKKAALGTTLAFMMSVTALSFPEAIILRKVLKPKLIAVYFGTVGLGIIAVGYLFNALFS